MEWYSQYAVFLEEISNLPYKIFLEEYCYDLIQSSYICF